MKAADFPLPDTEWEGTRGFWEAAAREQLAIPRCAAYTPVPGGVGPMTIATLIEQTCQAAERAAGLAP